MKRQPALSIAIIILWIVTLILLCMEGLRHAGAQDEPPTTITIFTFSCYMTEEGYANVLMTSDGVEHYTFANEDGIDTTIPSTFMTEVGVVALGRVSIYGTYTLSFARDDGAIALLAMSEDWQTWCDKVNTPPESTPEPMEVPTAPPPSVPVVMSMGRTCVIQYPKIILVCNGN